jgi:hypothetical protein
MYDFLWRALAVFVIVGIFSGFWIFAQAERRSGIEETQRYNSFVSMVSEETPTDNSLEGNAAANILAALDSDNPVTALQEVEVPLDINMRIDEWLVDAKTDMLRPEAIIWLMKVAEEEPDFRPDQEPISSDPMHAVWIGAIASLLVLQAIVFGSSRYTRKQAENKHNRYLASLTPEGLRLYHVIKDLEAEVSRRGYYHADEERKLLAEAREAFDLAEKSAKDDEKMDELHRLTREVKESLEVIEARKQKRAELRG